MTLPNNQPPNPAPEYGITGVPAAGTPPGGGNTIADLINRTQPNITSILKQQMAQSTGWNASTANVWAGLRRGTAGNPVPLMLAALEKFLNQVTGNNNTYNDLTHLYSDAASFFSGNWSSLTAIGTDLSNTWNDFWNGIFGGSATGKTAADMQTAAASVSSTANTASTNATNALSQWSAAITAAGQSTATAFGNFVSSTWSNLQSTWNGFWNGTYGTSATGKTAADVQTAAATTASTANTASTNASSALSQLLSAITNAGQSTAAAFGTLVSSTWSNLQSTWNSFWNGTYGSSATGKTAADVQTAAASTASTANTAGTNASSALSQFTSMLSAASQATATAFGTFLSTTATNLQTGWDAFWQGATGGTTTGHGTSDVKTAAAATASTANTASTNATTAGTNASSALSQLSNMLTAASQATATAFGNFLSTTATNLQTGWDDLWQGLTGGSTTGNTPATVKTAAASTSSTANTASSNASTALTNAATAGTNANTALANAAAAATSASTAQALTTRIPQNNIVPNTGAGSSSVTVDHAGSGGSATWPSGTVNGSIAATGTQTVGATASVVVAEVTYSLVGAVGVTGYLNASVGGQQMQILSTAQIPSTTQYLATMILWQPTAGTNLTVNATVYATNGGVASISFESCSYIGAVTASVPVQASGTGTSLSQTIAAATGTMVVQAFSAADVAFKSNTALSGYSGGTQRGNVTVQVNSAQYGYQSLAMGDAVGAASVTFTATGADANAEWVGTGFVLSAQQIPGSTFRSHVATTTTALTLAGANTAGIFTGAPVDYCSADLTYNATTGTVTVSLAGTYVVTVSILEAAVFTQHYTRAAVFHNGNVAAQGTTTYVSTTLSGTTVLQMTCELECAAGDTIQPGYWSSTGVSACHTGESTGSCTYWTVALANRSLL